MSLDIKAGDPVRTPGNPSEGIAGDRALTADPAEQPDAPARAGGTMKSKLEGLVGDVSRGATPPPPPGFVPMEDPPPPPGFVPMEEGELTRAADSSVAPPSLPHAIASAPGRLMDKTGLTRALGLQPEPEPATDRGVPASSLGIHSVSTPQGPAVVTARGAPVEPPNNNTQRDLAMRTWLLNKVGAATRAPSLGMGPAIKGLSSGVEALIAGNQDPDAAYSRARTQQAADEASMHEQGGVPAQIAGAMLNPIGGGTSMLVRGGVGLAQAGISAANESPGDMTRPGFLGQYASDAVEGAKKAAPYVLGGEALAGSAGWLARKFGGIKAGAEAAQQASNTMDLTQKGQSLLGSARSLTAQAQRKLEFVDRVLANPNQFDAEALALAQRMTVDPEVVAIRNSVAKNSMRDLRGMLPDLEQSRQMASDALTDIPAKAAALTAEQLQPGAAAQNLVGRLWKSFGQRSVLGTVAGALGDTPGAAAISPGGLQAARNIAKNPADKWLGGHIGEAVAGRAQQAVSTAGNVAGRVSATAKPKTEREQADDVAARAFLWGN